MARSVSTKKPRILASFNHSVKVEVRESEFKWLESIRHLDVDALSKTARAEVEVGEVKTECCRHLVKAVIRGGKVTGVRAEPVSESARAPMTPELNRLLKVVRGKLMARRARGPRFLIPVKQFLATSAEMISMGTLTCFQICIFGWCFACCWTDVQIFCGKITIDTTKFPYPEFE